MRSKHIISRLLGIIGILSRLPYMTHAYSLRQFSNKDGLSNSAILSLYQDNQGVIWIGSCDGLNMYDGNSIHAYNPPNSSKTLLSGNLINNFMETGKNVLWIQTNYGLDRLDLKKTTSQSFVEFKDNRFMTKSKDNELFTLKDDGYFYYYQQEKGTFRKLEVPQPAFEYILSTTIDANNILWVFTSNNDNRSFSECLKR